MTNHDLKGLILIGGSSTRMGREKALLELDGETLYLRTARLLKSIIPDVYLSGKKSQRDSVSKGGFTLIPDAFENMGPLAGILSAFDYFTEAPALLVLATDMPFLNQASIEKLIGKRDKKKWATMYRNPQTGFPEPLFAIYEGKARDRFLSAIEKNVFAIYKILSADEINLIDATDPRELTNINYPDQWDSFLSGH